MVTLTNRRRIDYTHRLTEIVEAAKQIKDDFTIDTEAIYVNPATKEVEFVPCQGLSSGSPSSVGYRQSQPRSHLTSGKRRCSTQDWAKQYFLRQKYPITAMAFDIMELNGSDLTKQPYLARKKLLFELLEDAPPEIQYVSHTLELEKAWQDVVKRQAEGLIIKNCCSSYVYERSYSWLKIKNWKYETFDIAGYTYGIGSRSAFFGSLVLSKNGEYRGNVGSGFNDWQLRQLKDIFSAAPKIPKPFNIEEDYVSLKLDLRVRVKYYKTTQDGLLRFPIFDGIVE